MTTWRRVLSSICVGIYGAVAGALFGVIITFWMWGLGFLLTLPLGLCCGAALGWNMRLRDSVILFAGCFSGLLMAKWISLGLAWGYIFETNVLLAVIALSAPLCWLIQKRLNPLTRLRLAVLLAASCPINLLLFIAIRA